MEKYFYNKLYKLGLWDTFWKGPTKLSPLLKSQLNSRVQVQFA